MDLFRPGAVGHGGALVSDGGPGGLLHRAVGLRPGVRTGRARPCPMEKPNDLGRFQAFQAQVLSKL